MESINNESINALNQKKDLLENTIAELKKNTDEMAFEAEKQSKVELFSKSNALKQAATEKQVELGAYPKRGFYCAITPHLFHILCVGYTLTKLLWIKIYSTYL